jgi:hypothetical protein
MVFLKREVWAFRQGKSDKTFAIGMWMKSGLYSVSVAYGRREGPKTGDIRCREVGLVEAEKCFAGIRNARIAHGYKLIEKTGAVMKTSKKTVVPAVQKKTRAKVVPVLNAAEKAWVTRRAMAVAAAVPVKAKRMKKAA